MARRARIGLAIMFAVFILLGLPEGVLGTAWPSMRASFNQPVSSLAWLVGSYTGGYLMSALASGHLSARFGVSITLRCGLGVTALGFALYASSPTWSVAVGGALVTGLGAGTVDSTANAYCAVVAGARAMNLLHAFFGVGATLGPIAVTVALAINGGWRTVYLAMLVLELALFLTAARYRMEWANPTAVDQASSERQPMHRGLLLLTLVVFFFYAGGEAAYGHWSFSLLTDERGVGSTAAAWAVAGFWAGLTAGRLLLAAFGRALPPARVLASSLSAVLVGALVFWLDPLPGSDVVALSWLGLSMAGIFPAMVLLTPVWLGVGSTTRAVGYQLAASSAGAIVVTVGIAASVAVVGLESMPLVAAAVAVGTYVAFLAAQTVARRRSSSGHPLVSRA